MIADVGSRVFNMGLKKYDLTDPKSANKVLEKVYLNHSNDESIDFISFLTLPIAIVALAIAGISFYYVFKNTKLFVNADTSGMRVISLPASSNFSISDTNLHYVCCTSPDGTLYATFPSTTDLFVGTFLSIAIPTPLGVVTDSRKVIISFNNISYNLPCNQGVLFAVAQEKGIHTWKLIRNWSL